MKTIARVLMILAVLALLGVLAAVVGLFIRYGVTTKTVLGLFVALLACGGLLGRLAVVARDSLPGK